MIARQPGAAGRHRARLFLLLSLLLVACSPGASSVATRPTATPRSTVGATPGGPTPTAGTIDHVSVETVNWYLRHMTLDEKLGQMMLIETLYQSYAPDVDNMVRNLHAGAMIVYKQNMMLDNPAGPPTLRRYVNDIQAHATIPLMVTMDEEGGGVDRLGLYGFAPPLPSPQDTANTGNPQNAYDAGARGAKQMLSFGINTNLAPLADVRLTDGSILYTRMYGTDPQKVTAFAGAFLRGVQDNGVIGTLKHWPGIGSITTDPHQTLPVMSRNLSQLQATEFSSFRALLPLQPGMVMVTHVVVPALDPTLPATLSPKVVQGVLRDQLGYQGVVMTDSLYMKGISLQYNLGQAAVLSVMAGDDLLEGAFDSYSMRFMMDSIKAAMADGRISQQRIDQSVRRILALKLRFGLLPLRDHSRGASSVRALSSAPLSPADLSHRVS
jgi:beta-N-acetylhexosaminidase